MVSAYLPTGASIPVQAHRGCASHENWQSLSPQNYQMPRSETIWTSINGPFQGHKIKFTRIVPNSLAQIRIASQMLSIPENMGNYLKIPFHLRNDPFKGHHLDSKATSKSASHFHNRSYYVCGVDRCSPLLDLAIKLIMFTKLNR